jgi:hypothetical protein
VEEIFKLKEELLALLDKLLNKGITQVTGLYGPVTLSLVSIKQNMLSVETSTMDPKLLINILTTMKEKLGRIEDQIQTNERPI